MSNENTSSPSPFNRWWFIAAGLLLAVAVVLGLILSGVLGNHSTTSDRNPGGGGGNNQPVASSSAGSGGGGSEDADACSLSSGSQSIPTSGPAATWKSNVYFQYPTSTQYGPTSNPATSEWGCFAHNPTGALFASANLFSGLGGSDYEAVAKAAGVDNQARAQWIGEQSPAQHSQSAGQVGQIAGFQYESVKSDAVVISLGFAQDDTQAAITISMVWDSSTSNWKVDFATSNFQFAQVDLSNYTTWSASNG